MKKKVTGCDSKGVGEYDLYKRGLFAKRFEQEKMAANVNR